MNGKDLYAGREQTLVKHLILRKYLERFAHIIGSSWNSITYVDCFSGPWNVRSDDLSDSSFAIALQELRKARDTYRRKGKEIHLRCLFLEKNTTAFAKLREFADQASDVDVVTHNKELESAIDDILRFIRKGGETFPFLFIDPTGWSGFAMEFIEPLLKLDPGEVLINFISGHIMRFIDSPQDETHESFIRLFGSASFKAHIEGLAKQDREDALVAAYCECVRRTGSFDHVLRAIVLHPQKDRTHFNLIYATRHPKGVEAFKNVEKKAMSEMENARAGAQKRRREQRSGMGELFSTVLHESAYYDLLRTRYLTKSQNSVLSELRSRRRLPYDDAWLLALAQPLVWESDLKDWIRTWITEGALTIEGMAEQQRVPQRGKNNRLVWLRS